MKEVLADRFEHEEPGREVSASFVVSALEPGKVRVRLLQETPEESRTIGFWVDADECENLSAIFLNLADEIRRRRA